MRDGHVRLRESQLHAGCILALNRWRKRRDSNPRYPFRYASFQDWSHQPLGHSSYPKFSTHTPDHKRESWHPFIPGAMKNTPKKPVQSKKPKLPKKRTREEVNQAAAQIIRKRQKTSCCSETSL